MLSPVFLKPLGWQTYLIFMCTNVGPKVFHCDEANLETGCFRADVLFLLPRDIQDWA